MHKHRLHPVAAVIQGVKSLKGMILPAIIIFAANGFTINLDFRDEDFWMDLIPILILCLVVILTFISGIIRWVTFRYWFEDSELRIQYGLFVKKNRFIPFDRIQTLNYKEGIFHRLFGLVQVSVETAGGEALKAEADLTAITKAAANQIEEEMNAAKFGREVAEEQKFVKPDEHVIYKMTPLELVGLATTSGGIGVIIAGVFTVVSQFADLLPFERIVGQLEGLIEFSAVVISMLVFLGLVFAWILSVALTMLNYYDFKVAVENERIVITRGLIEKKRITVPLNRIHAVKIVENPLRQLFGWATVKLETAGGQVAEKGEGDLSVKLFPLIVKKEMYEPLQELFPQYHFKQHADAFTKSPKRARPFFYRIDFLWTLPIVALASYFLFPYGLLSILIFIPIILLGIWQHKTAAFVILDNQMTLVSRFISKVTFVTSKNRIQSMQMRQSYFQKRRDVATVRVTVMSGVGGASAEAYHMERKKVERCMSWYEHKKPPQSILQYSEAESLVEMKNELE